MDYQFDDFILRLDHAALYRGDTEIALEPRAYDLLSLLVRNQDRVLSRDEIVEKVWDGRIISDAAISTVVKTTRRALKDDGAVQKYIRTVRGRGFRFAGAARPIIGATANPLHDGPDDRVAHSPRPSIAILPFGLLGQATSHGAIADAIPAELISGLSRLRWLKVVARGSTFRFRGPDPDMQVIRTSLGAGYCLSGLVEVMETRLAVTVELADTRSHAVIWSDRFSGGIGDIHQIRTGISDQVISALELHIPLNEARRARLQPPETLDAWDIYHLGLQHMYRFNRADNLQAALHFEHASRLDPNFARAYAARSFTSFQSAFLKYAPDRAREVENARRFAESCLELDPLDPFGNFTLGRAHWLQGDPEAGLPWIDRAISLSPNFAQGFYAHGWADVMAGRGASALDQVDRAISLSPLDPFLYAMLATRALAHMLQGDLDAAAIWADRGAHAPGAHFLIGAIAAAMHQMRGNGSRAQHWAQTVQDRRPDASIRTFFTAFPFESIVVRTPLHHALAELGFPES
ncbi:winged helix-turn-helix domain-containing tetratricopeptide repeat protein [Sedimentitalea nanhaiensis]|uniref:TolB amino-terminal domain-containing protein n=1 Tax=Sedimentitalea nanhaiensis TaxID=999627 RepID=A0A1I6Z3L5_9RHOB|nr:winged helix-turn-helix domain-containing protein [Sedimentitalea nanhaiensis]SFT57302.1 TolB amino-terminal domain-containing protein [Sedimentitalea nanhaiensis]